MNVTRIVLIVFLLVCCETAFAQVEQAEPLLVVEIGGTASRSVTQGKSSFGPTVAIEATPIENRLELEAGVTSLFRRHSTEWDTDLLFKKPWSLSEHVEFMLGAGPEWIYSREYGQTSTNSVAIEVEPEFMIWRSSKHRFGWYVEPSYEYNFGRGREQSLAVSGGLLIGLP